MVNTRRSSQPLQSDESRSLAAEQSDSSTTSTTRRTTRRSIGNVPSTPVEIPTPNRRPRRLSNSSIESGNNDTPRPAARRSTRNKPTAGSDNETSDVELVVIKRRKLVEGVDTLIPISEEKTEEHANPTKGKDNHILVDLDEEKEDETCQKPETSMAKSVETKNLKPTVKMETAGTPVKTEDTKSPVTKGELKFTVVREDNISVKMECVDNLESQVVNERMTEDVVSLGEVTEVAPMILKVDEIDKSDVKCEIAVSNVDVSKESMHSTEEPNNENFFTPVSTPTNLEDGTKHTEKTTCTTSVEQQSVTTDDKQAANTENHLEQEEENNKPSEPSPLKETDTMPTSDSLIQPVVEKPRMLFGVPISSITVNKSLMMKKSKGKRDPMERKIRRIRKKVEPPKESLPCGADIMRNIPRGKSKSGREWKEPKSNPRYLYQDKGLKMPFEKITQLRQERQRVKELENRMKEEERARRAEITRRREINKKREEENARRGEVVQVIRNTNKIKRMKKKQLKLIQKRDTTTVV